MRQGAAGADDAVPGRAGARVRPAGRAGRADAAGAGGANADRANWDAPYIISPHSPRRLYWASNYVYRSDDRGDSWTRISPDLTRQLKWDELPIMGKVWPADSVAYHESTTALSNVVSLDESPLLEGLIYAGTDDGLLQVTEDGGKNWRKIEDFPGVPKWTYVSDVFASPRDANTVFVALNNWQRGDYKPYLVRAPTKDGRGRTSPAICPIAMTSGRSIQDHVNGNLLFAGTEFGLFTSVDGGGTGCSSKAACRRSRCATWPCRSARTISCSRRSAAASTCSTTTARCARSRRRRSRKRRDLFPLRDAYLFNPTGPGARGHGRHRRDGGQLDEPQSAVRRGAHLQRQAARCRATRSS